MARLTRAESQSRNRELVVAAARKLFLSDGYQATSLAAIAEEVGFSTGVVYSNFSGKADLARIVLHDIQAEKMKEIDAVLRDSRPLTEQLDAIGAWAERGLASGWPRFELEFAMEGRADPELVQFEAARHSWATEALAERLSNIVPAEIAAFLPLKSLSEAIMNLSIGLAVRRLIDPTVTADSMLDPLRALLVLAGSPATSR